MVVGQKDIKIIRMMPLYIIDIWMGIKICSPLQPFVPLRSQMYQYMKLKKIDKSKKI